MAVGTPAMKPPSTTPRRVSGQTMSAPLGLDAGLLQTLRGAYIDPQSTMVLATDQALISRYPQQGCQRPRTLGEPFEKNRGQYRYAAEGLRPAPLVVGGIAHYATFQQKVAALLERRIGHQNEMGQLAGRQPQAGKIEVTPDVAVDQQKGFGAK